MGTAFRQPQMPHQPTSVCYWAGRFTPLCPGYLHAFALPSTAASNFANVISYVLSH